VFYVTIGSGVGAGLIINKKIYYGAEPGEMEFGHVRLDRSGATIQDKCSGWAVNQKIKDVLSDNPITLLHSLCKQFPEHEAKALGEALASNDIIAHRIVSETMNDLSFGLSHAVHLLHPDVIILGGGLSLLGEILVREVENFLPDYLMDAFQPGPSIRLSSLKESAVPLGAISLALDTN
jgi:glucokinase